MDDAARNKANRQRPLERVRGTNDLLAGEAQALGGLSSALMANARTHGYVHVAPPAIEHTELFLRKSGGDRIAQMYAFAHHGRDIALRPEFTAGVVRLFIDHLQAEPLPQRLAVVGPVFRYEKPQAGRARQFTEFGCELIGASGPLADVEVIRLALDGLQLAGVERPRLVLGHIGIVHDFLSALDIDQRAQDWLTWSMERLRRGDDRAHELPEHLQRRLSADAEWDVDTAGLDLAAISALLQQAGVQFQSSSRTPEEIVQGLIAKRSRRYDEATLRDAARFVQQLAGMRGRPADVLGPLRELVSERNLVQGPLDELVAIIELLGDAVDVELDLGMGRGLHYYTGMLFEIYGGPEGTQQLTGGGRYDDLAQLLGARGPVPACGFSYGLERVLANGASLPEPARWPRVLVLAPDPAIAMQLARRLRVRGWQAELDVRGRNASATRRTAQRQGYVALVEATDTGVRFIRPSDGVGTEFRDVPVPEEVTF